MIAVEGAQAVEAVLVVDLVQRIREEFEEAPSLTITVRDAARFWGLDEETCGHVLAQLLATGFGCEGGDGRYRQT